MTRLEEYEDILNKIQEHNLQFLGLIDMSRDEALDKLKKLKFSTYNASKTSVNYHASKPFSSSLYNSSNPIDTPYNNSQPIIAHTESTQRKVETVTPEYTLYEKILNPKSNTQEIDAKYLAIREEYLQELENLESKGGCSGCQRGKLKRKFIEKLTALDKSNSES
jgi:hypothetical protein